MTHFCPCDRVCILSFDFLPSNTFASGQYLTCLKIEGLKCSQVVRILQNIGIWSRHTVSVVEIKKNRPMMPSRWVNFVDHLIFDLKYLKYPNHLICSFILTLSMERPMWHSTKRSLGFVSLEEALCKPFTCHTTCTKGSLMPWSNHTFYRVWPSNHYWVFIPGTPQNKSKAGHKPSPNMGSSWMLNVFQRKL